MLEAVIAELETNGLLLKTDPKLPNVCAIVAGEPVRGSWWSHAKSHQMFHVLTELASHCDVLTAKLISGKDTFVHRSLWSAFLAVAMSREPWQFAALDAKARALLKQVEEQGEVKTSGLAAGASWSAWVLTGVLFGVTHVPNPVLMPATLVWGVVAARMFEHRPALIPIAMLQTLLSALLLWLTPADWSHQFRIGPGYWY